MQWHISMRLGIALTIEPMWMADTYRKMVQNRWWWQVAWSIGLIIYRVNCVMPQKTPLRTYTYMLFLSPLFPCWLNPYKIYVQWGHLLLPSCHCKFKIPWDQRREQDWERMSFLSCIFIIRKIFWFANLQGWGEPHSNSNAAWQRSKDQLAKFCFYSTLSFYVKHCKADTPCQTAMSLLSY